MQAVIAACFVMQHQRRGLCLPCFVTDLEIGGVIERIWVVAIAKHLDPLVGYLGEVGIGGGAEVWDRFGQRIREVFVIADAEAVAFHDYVAAEAGWFAVERDDRSAFFG